MDQLTSFLQDLFFPFFFFFYQHLLDKKVFALESHALSPPFPKFSPPLRYLLQLDVYRNESCTLYQHYVLLI